MSPAGPARILVVEDNDTNRALGADAQTLTFGAVTDAFRPREIELLEARLDVLPGFGAFRRVNAVGANADEQMSLQLSDAKATGHDGWGKMFGVCHCG